MIENVLHELMDSIYSEVRTKGDGPALIRMHPRFFHELASLDKFQTYISMDIEKGFNRFNGTPVEITSIVDRYSFLTKSDIARRSRKKMINYEIDTMDRLESADGSVEYNFVKQFEGYDEDWNRVYIQIVADQILRCKEHDEVILTLGCNGFLNKTSYSGVQLRNYKELRIVYQSIEHSLRKIKIELEKY